MSRADSVFDEVKAELMGAISTFPAFNSGHEGYAVILEELDELWEEVRKGSPYRISSEARGEAIQVAAMAIRFVIDLPLREEER